MNFWILGVLTTTALSGQVAGTDLFEKEIRPVLVNKCYGCHSSKLKVPMGGLVLDSKSGLRKGGASGAGLVPGDPDASRMMRALSYADPQLRMPPTGKLKDQEIAAFRKWIADGAPDPRPDVPQAATALKGMDLETGRKWWSLQPVTAASLPKANDAGWPRQVVDFFVLEELKKNKLEPSPEADPRTLVQRAYLDLTGLRPSYEEVESFVNDRAPDAYERLIEQLMASPRYGERWGRYWLDVARFADDNPTSEETNRPYPYAWRYRDWVIDAVNRDIPYDRFVTLQLAADLLPGTPRHELPALGFLGAAPVYHKDARLSRDIVETLFTDDWDERVDSVSRGILGLSVACARCHDHKFDPITQKDYYGLAGVFASTFAVPRPLPDVGQDAEKRFMFAAQQLFYLDYVAGLMCTTKGEAPAAKCERLGEELDKVKAGFESWKESQPELYSYLSRFRRSKPLSQLEAEKAAAAKAPPSKTPVPRLPRPRWDPTDEPFFQGVYDAGLWVDGSDPDLTMLLIKPGVSRDLRVLLHGSVATPGDPAPRKFLDVLAKSNPAFEAGSGRLELARKIFSDAAPLTSRVIVNRVWGWHFGKPLVSTPSDFGTQGERPTHPQLLDDLAARFISNGWSLKWLHREIMLSAAYRQSSRMRPDAAKTDPANRLVWRMTPRRLDIEAYRDSLLRIANTLDARLYGPSADLDDLGNVRRTVYGKVSREHLNTLLRIYDFPDPAQHSPGRELTTTPLQQLFVLNSGFIEQQAAALAKNVESQPDSAGRIRLLYRLVLARNPSPTESSLLRDYLTSGTLAQLAQSLLSTNEVIFWP